MFWPNASMLNLRAAMLAEHAPSLPVGPEWEYEFVWPGERVLAAKEGPGVRLTSVSHRRDVTNRFPVIAAMIAKLGPTRVMLDGVVGPVEPRMLGDEAAAGPPGAARIAFVASDVLWIDEADLRLQGLAERRRRLHELIADSGIVAATTPPVGGADMMAEARRRGAEAILAKRAESKYRPHARSGEWIRVTITPAASPQAQPRRAKADDRATPPLGLGQVA